MLARIAKLQDATPYQIALAFLTRLPGTFSIPKSSDPERARQNATRVQLTDEQARELDAAFPFDGARELPVI